MLKPEVFTAHALFAFVVSMSCRKPARLRRTSFPSEACRVRRGPLSAKPAPEPDRPGGFGAGSGKMVVGQARCASAGVIGIEQSRFVGSAGVRRCAKTVAPARKRIWRGIGIWALVYRSAWSEHSETWLCVQQSGCCSSEPGRQRHFESAARHLSAPPTAALNAIISPPPNWPVVVIATTMYCLPLYM